MLSKLVIGEIYTDEKGDQFRVFGIGLYGKSKRIEMVLHQNLEPTDELPKAFTACIRTKKQFMKHFNEVVTND